MPYFNTDDALYKNFKLICGINDQDVGKTITQLIRDYVDEYNKNSEQSLPSRIVSEPTPSDSPKSWHQYIRNLDENGFVNFDNRLYFLSILMKWEYMKSNRKQVKTLRKNIKVFFNSDERKYLKNHDIPIVLNHHEMESLPDFPKSSNNNSK